MEYSQPWTYAFPEAVYNPASSSSASVSSYFVRPNKVVKPTSRNNSPRSLGRRKTTTSATISSRTKSVVDHLRAATQQWPNSNGTRSRPVSWHPNSMDDFYGITCNPDTSIHGQDTSTFAFSTTNVHGLITPISYPIANEPQIQELITPLDEYPGGNPIYTCQSQLVDAQPWSSQPPQKLDDYSFNLFYQSSQMQPSWQFGHSHSQQPYASMHVQTAPSSPDCLPTQVDSLSLDTTNLDSKDTSEELVGMGLYDSPADVQSSSLLFGSISNQARKGLKLEESFEPEECEDEEVEDSQEQDESEEDESAFQVPKKTDYSSQSIANHMGFLTQQEPDPIASKYLATLGQLSSEYYPTTHASYGWI